VGSGSSDTSGNDVADADQSTVAASGAAGEASLGPASGADALDADALGDLEEVVLPSLVQAPSPLSEGAVLGPDGRASVVRFLGARGRVNRYAATWRDDAGGNLSIELREAPIDHVGLRREVQILSDVRHAMLPAPVATFEDGQRLYLAVGERRGETLADALRAGIAPEDALSLVVQLAQVVRRLHRGGWAIPGLAPGDVLLGQPLSLAQLGHAERIGESPKQVMHVAGYSAPELAYGETVTGKEDVYALAAILYHALAGRALPESGAEHALLSSTVRTPGAPQLIAGALAPDDERIDLDTFYRGALALRQRLTRVTISLEVASATSVGLNPTRHVNEDSCGYAVWSLAVADGEVYRAFLCVADGMGGMDAGEVASRAALTAVARGSVSLPWFPPVRLESDTGTPSEPPSTPADEAARAPGAQSSAPPPAVASAEDGPPPLDPIALIREAATTVYAAGHGRQMGTTITLVAVHDGQLTLGHVGDTRAYLIRDGALARLTADHSLVAAMVASGVITAEEAIGHPDNNKVLRSLGGHRELPTGYVDSLEEAFGQPTLQLRPGDWLVLCSDGVWGCVRDAEILTIATEALDPPTVARRLIERALEEGAPDNAAAVVARVVRMPAA